MAHRTPTGVLIVGCMLLISLLACNMSSDENLPEAPPTITPIPPYTAIPTLTIPPSALPAVLPTFTPSPLPVLPPTIPPTPLPVVTLPPTAVALAGPLSIPDQVALVSPERLMNTVNWLVNFGNRHVMSVPSPNTGIYAARSGLLNQFAAIWRDYPTAPIDLFTHEFQFSHRGQTVTAQNIVFVLRGTDPNAGPILVGAHYDTVGSDPTRADTFQPGADDNGSGVAAVLEIARILAQSPHRATVICVLFAAEEQGNFGSQALVRDMIQATGIPLRAMINLDGIGDPMGLDGSYLGNQLRVYSAPPSDSASRQLAYLVDRTTQLYIPEMRVDVLERVDRLGRWGDHMSFSDAGYAAIRLIEPADDPRRLYADTDPPDNLDPEYMRRVTQVALATILVLAESDGLPVALLN
jgi:hypothetical protein